MVSITALAAFFIQRPLKAALLDGLERFEADLHRHVHKENNVLFPRALAVVAG